MKAIIQKSLHAQGEHVQMLGYGDTEREARINAAHYLADGFSKEAEFDGRGFEGGELIEVSESLAKLLNADHTWNDTFDEEGSLVASNTNDAHHAQLQALSCLYVNIKGELDAHLV